MELNINCHEYSVYQTLLEKYLTGEVEDDEIILLYKDEDGTIKDWYYNHEYMRDFNTSDPNIDIKWILLYNMIGHTFKEAIVLDTLLELEYRLMGSPKIKELREKLGFTLDKLAFELRMPARTLERIEKGLEMPPNYIMRRIYVKLVNEVEQKEFEEENPRDDFLDKLLNGTLNEDNKKDEKYNEALEATIAEMLDDSIDNLGKNKKNNFEDEEIYITPSKTAIDNFYKKAFADLEEKIQKNLEDND